MRGNLLAFQKKAGTVLPVPRNVRMNTTRRPPDREDTSHMAIRKCQTQRDQRFVGMPASASIVSATLPLFARSGYAALAGATLTQGGHKWEHNPVGANLS